MTVRKAVRMTVVRQHFNNSTFPDLAMCALPDHPAQLGLQRQQPFDLGLDIRQHVARNAIDAFTGLVGPVRQVEKFPNGVEGKAQLAGMANESEPPGMVLFIAPLAARTA